MNLLHTFAEENIKSIKVHYIATRIVIGVFLHLYVAVSGKDN